MHHISADINLLLIDGEYYLSSYSVFSFFDITILNSPEKDKRREVTSPRQHFTFSNNG